jgi:hypothetical protein
LIAAPRGPIPAGALLDRYAAQQRPVVLALEINTNEQPRFDRYLASHGTDADRAALLAGDHWQERHHDGRDSEAMFDLIEHMREVHARGADVALAAAALHAVRAGDFAAMTAAHLRPVPENRGAPA